MTYNDNRKVINYVEMDEDTHTWLKSEANKKGVRIGKYAGVLLTSVMNNEIILDDDDITMSWFKSTLEKNERNKVYQTAAMYAEFPTEKLADRLKDMCDKAGLDYQEVVLEAKNDPFSSIVAQSRNGTKFGECLQWLPKKLQERGGQMFVTPLRIQAERQGFTISMLDRVKRAINNDSDTPFIESVKVGKSWAWKVHQVEDG